MYARYQPRGARKLVFVAPGGELFRVEAARRRLVRKTERVAWLGKLTFGDRGDAGTIEQPELEPAVANVNGD